MATTLSLTEHRKAGKFSGWKKYVLGRLFHLGMEKNFALGKAAYIVQLSAGLSEWTPESLAAIAAYGRAAATSLPSLATVTPLTSPAAVSVPQIITGLTTHAALEEFIKSVRADPQRSGAWKMNLCRQLGQVKTVMPDISLATVTYDTLEAITSHYAALPVSIQTEKQISTTQAINLINAAAQLFRWLDKTDRWTPCRHWQEAFKVDARKLCRNSNGKKKNGIENFDLDTLTKLHQNASERTRLYMLCGLCLGLTQNEIATLTCSEIDLAKKMVARERTKTGVYGEWPLCNELADLLAKHKAPTNEAGLWLMSEAAKPLVIFHEKSRTDVIHLAWHRLTEKLELKTGPKAFKLLRKYGADWVRQNYGLEVAQMYLAHSGQSVAERHYTNADFSKLAKAVSALRVHLQPIFEVQIETQTEMKLAA